MSTNKKKTHINHNTYYKQKKYKAPSSIRNKLPKLIDFTSHTNTPPTI